MRIVALIFVALSFQSALAVNAPNVCVLSFNPKDKNPPKVVNYEIGTNNSIDVEIPGWDHKCSLMKGEGFKEDGVTYTQHYFRCAGKGGVIMQSLVCPSKDTIAQHSLTIEAPKLTYKVLLRCKLP